MARILVVDDSALVRRTVCELLQQAGHETDTAASGEEAVEKTLLSAFDLVVSDVRMGAMTGVQLCRVLRSEPLTRNLPVVLLTASSDPRSRFWGHHAGADAYLAKETSLAALPSVVQGLLARRRPSDDTTAVRPQRVDAAARVSAVLDRQLFEAVVASEARALMAHIGDRAALMRSVANLCSEVLSAPTTSFTILGPDGTSHAVVAHAPFVEADFSIEALSLEPTDEPPLVLASTAERLALGEFTPGPCEAFELEVAGERIGMLRVFGGAQRVGSDDRVTATLLAASLAPVVKSALLVEETRRLAYTDLLTGLVNRRVLVERLELEDRRSARYGVQLAAVMLDVDNFKAVNDRYGHAAGDEVLRAIARVLTASVRNVDLAGRWGGEEFLILLPNCDIAGARMVAERICQAVRSLPPFPGGPEHVTVSCGCATRNTAPPTAARLVEHADQAMYRAKRLGRDRVVD